MTHNARKHPDLSEHISKCRHCQEESSWTSHFDNFDCWICGKDLAKTSLQRFISCADYATGGFVICQDCYVEAVVYAGSKISMKSAIDDFKKRLGLI